MPPSAWKVLAWGCFALAVALLGCNAVVIVLNTRGPDPMPVPDVARDLVLLAIIGLFPVVGLLIALRQPRNAIGWVLLAVGAVNGLASTPFMRYATVTAPDRVPHADVVAAVLGPLWVLLLGLIGTFLLLLFPDGRLPTPRWRPLAWFSAVSMAVLYVGILLFSGTMTQVTGQDFYPTTAPNPLVVVAVGPACDALLLLLPLSILMCAVSIVVRFRRSQGRERLQLEWLAWSGAVAAVVYLVTITLATGNGAWGQEGVPGWLAVVQELSFVSFLLIPVSIGIAILRHQLWDIEVIIDRTLVYGALTLSLAALYAGGVLGVGALLRAVTGQERSGLAVAASTLAVAALFAPLRTRIQAAVDRRFYRNRYDAQQEVVQFARRMRDPGELPDLQTDLVATVAWTIQPAGAAVLLRRG